MAIASLGLKIDESKSESSIIILETGTLRYIDSITKSFPNAEELKLSEDFFGKLSHLASDVIERSEVMLSYIRNNDERVMLQPIYNDSTPINIRTNSMDDIKSETERARKLLYSSKNQIFLLLFLNHKSLVNTTYFTIKMTVDEYKKIKNDQLSILVKDGEYHITVKDVLKYRFEHKKLGIMRTLVEDSLELWKKKLLDLSDEELYYYSRELRVLLNEYDYRKIPRRAVCNLCMFNNKITYFDNLVINKENGNFVKNTRGLYKMQQNRV